MGNKKYSASDMVMAFVCLLIVLFVLLKAFGVITWTWWWVFSPLWFSVVGYTIYLIGKSFTFTRRQ